MDSKSSSSCIAFFLCINLILFSLINGCSSCDDAQPPPSPAAITKTCPRDVLKLEVCTKLLNGTDGGDSGCCSFLGGLFDFEAAVCLCTAIKANVLGMDINIPISMRLIFNDCGKRLPEDFYCAPS